MNNDTSVSSSTRWIQLVISSLILLLAGMIYAWSILNAPLKTALGFDGTQLSFCFTLTLCFFCLGGLISGLLAKKLSPRIRMIAAAVLSAGGFAITALQQGSVLLLDLGYGVLAGLGIGFVYNVVISSTSAWFPDRKGLCSGVMMMAFGFSSLLIGKVANALFSMEAFGWRKTYALLGAVLGLVLLAGAFLLKSAPAKKRSAGADGEKDVPTAKMIRTAGFWKLFAFFTLFAAVGAAAISFGKNFFLQVGLNESNAVTWAGLISIFNGLGRIVSGLIFDKLGLKVSRFAASFVVIAATGITLLSLVLSSAVLSVVGLMLCGFSYGFSPTLSAALVAECYGQKYFHLNFPVLNLVLIPASFSSTLAAMLVKNAGGSYISTFAVLLGASLVGLLINLSMKKNA